MKKQLVNKSKLRIIIKNLKMEKELIINVGRQIGSGGHIIAKMLADEFGCQYYDREILNIAAKESGFSEKFFEQNDEQKGFLKSHFHIHLPMLAATISIRVTSLRRAFISSKVMLSAR